MFDGLSTGHVEPLFAVLAGGKTVFKLSFDLVGIPQAQSEQYLAVLRVAGLKRAQTTVYILASPYLNAVSTPAWQQACDLGFRGSLGEWERLMGAAPEP